MSRSRPRIAVLMDIVFSTFQEEPKLGIDRYLNDNGLDAIYFGIGNLDMNNPESRSKSQLLNFVSKREFDGLLVITTSLTNYGGQEILKNRMQELADMPMVSIGPSLIGEDSLVYDGRDGTEKIMKHLIDVHGYRTFAYLSGPLQNVEARVRLEAFRHTLDEAGIPHGPEHEYEGNFVSGSGETAGAVFLDERKLTPDVIVCANDRMAIGVWNALQQRGCNIPHDIAITGFDDNRLSHTVSTQFTTVRQSFVTLGYLAVKRLHAKILGETPPRQEAFKAELQVRSSCGCIEYRKRQQFTDAKLLPENITELQERLEKIVEQSFPEKDVLDFYRNWSSAIRSTLSKRQLTYGFERALRKYGEIVPKKGHENTRDIFLSTLYTLLIEENNHSLVIESWNMHIFDQRLRVAVDLLENRLVNDLSFKSHAESFRNLASICKIKDLHFVRFEDFSGPMNGSHLVFSSSEGWKTGPGSWFPDESGSYALNMISNSDEKFGYFLIDSKITSPYSCDYMRIRFSAIVRDMIAMNDIRTLNDKLSHEILIRKETEQKLNEAIELVRQMSIQDDLTGLYNRRGFMTLAEQQIRYLYRQGKGFFLIYADLDGLKTINDSFGHSEGDLAIQSAARVFVTALRSSDIIARFGGDEFTALVCEANPPVFRQVKIRIHNECKKINKALKKPWKLMISIGHVQVEPGSDMNISQMLDKADMDLYSNKNAH